MDFSVKNQFDKMQEDKRESRKWTAFFSVFALICLAAMGITKYAEKHSDLLGGIKTVKQYLYSNVIAILLILAVCTAFIIIVSKTWKGAKGSISQFMMTIFAAVIILWTGIGKILAIHNITDDLNNIRKTTVREYVLCADSKGFYMGFEDKGEYILLTIPEQKYDELQNGIVSDDKNKNEVYSLIVNAQYDNYGGAELYCTPVNVEYYFNSVIYEGCAFA